MFGIQPYHVCLEVHLPSTVLKTHLPINQLVNLLDKHGACDIWQMPGTLNVCKEVGNTCKLWQTLKGSKCYWVAKKPLQKFANFANVFWHLSCMIHLGFILQLEQGKVVVCCHFLLLLEEKHWQSSRGSQRPGIKVVGKKTKVSLFEEDVVY